MSVQPPASPRPPREPEARPGTPSPAPAPPSATLRSLASATLDAAPERIALVAGEDVLSYAELDARVERHAAALRAAGVGPGDRVALLLRNVPQLAALYFACWRLGAIAVPVNVRYARPEVAYAAAQSGARLLIVQDDLAPKAAGLAAELDGLEAVLGLRETAEGLDGEWRSRVGRAGAAAPPYAPAPEDPALILYTSGSTSRPKGVVHCHRSIRETARTRALSMGYGADEVWLVATSMVHVSGTLGTLFPALFVGARAVLLERFDPAGFLALVRRHRPTRSILLPALMLDVLDHPDAARTDFSSFRALEVGGDAVLADHYARWAAFTDAPLCQILGMTECEGYCLTRPDRARKPSTVGQPREDVEVRVVDDEDRPLPPGEIGELELRSDSLTSGYWEDEPHTRAALREGWLHTSDLGRIDEDGYVTFVGRSSEMIIRRGSNIAPGEVEDVLETHPDVYEAVVVGVADPRIGQRVAAFVEPPPGRSVTGEALAAWMKGRIASFKIPERWETLDTLPRNAVGKLDRAALHRRADERFGPSSGAP